MNSKNKMIIYGFTMVIGLLALVFVFNNLFTNENPVVIYSDDKGQVTLVKWYFTPKGGNPGDTVTVRGYIYNGRTEPIRLYVESGIAPHGWKYFSVYGTPVQAPVEGGPCCPQNENYDGGYVTIQPGQYVYVELHPKIPTQNTIDHCHNLGSFYNGVNKPYDIAFIVVEPVNGDACWHSETEHGKTLYSSIAQIYVGEGGINFFGSYITPIQMLIIALLVIGIISSAIIIVYGDRL